MKGLLKMKFLPIATVSTDNPSFDPLSYIVALGRYYEILWQMSRLQYHLKHRSLAL